jgi:hypothetical protein
MLAPDQRRIFLEALRPPEGYQFDRGIGTTFTLDLLTLLVAPLSLALLEVSDSKAALSDPVLLLEGLRRYADRLTIFCQAGRIAIPPPDNYLYSFLEKSIVEVQAPRRGVFHPKVWLLRYVSESEQDPPLYRYRFLNLSRNLTFDKSWDLILQLEGYVRTDRQRAYGRNNPLGDFVQQLPQLALRPVGSRIADDIALLQDEARRVAFEVPWPFDDDLGFYPFGIPGYYYRSSVFDENRWRVLVISPFLSDPLLQRLVERGEGHVLISRADSIAALNPKTLARFDKIYALNEAGMAETEPESHLTGGAGEEVAGAAPEPSGLHAKLFIMEAGWDATWLLGSANATHAAFHNRNVEFMVRLRGRRSKTGIDKVLGEGEEDEENEDTLLSLLRPYRPGSQAMPDEEQKKAETLADRVRDWLVNLDMRLEVVEHTTDQFDLVLRRSVPAPSTPGGEYTVACWPVTLRSEHKVTFDCTSSSAPLTFSGLSLLALTPFIAFEVEAQVKKHRHTLRFVLNLPTSGIPQDRKGHLFSAIISDRSQFLRYLWVLLSDEEGNMSRWMDWASEEPGLARGTGRGDAGVPLLEAMMRALSRSPEKIDRIAELVEGLQRTPQGRQVLPEEFEPLWRAIVQTRSELQ